MVFLNGVHSFLKGNCDCVNFNIQIALDPYPHSGLVHSPNHNREWLT